jgi:hypothetical protein
MIDYLKQDEPVLRKSREKRDFAVAELLRRAAQYCHSFRLEFDAARLRRVLGRSRMDVLMPKLQPAAASQHVYDIYSDTVDQAKIDILQQILSPAPAQDYPEHPLIYIKSVRFLDESGATVLRGGDHNNAILFRLPASAMTALLEAYRDHGIPGSVIEQVDVDEERLTP